MPHAIGLDLGGTQLKYGIVTEGGTIEFNAARVTGRTKSPGQVLEIMSDAIGECLCVAKEKGFSIAGVGAACPGAIDTAAGVALGNVQHLASWQGTRIKDVLEDKCHLPVMVDNDANLMTFAESLLGAARGMSLVVGVTLGTGVGGGFVIDGEIYHGGNFHGAEIGHVVVEANGRPCPCGGRGCMTMYCGAAALASDAAAALPQDDSSLLHDIASGDTVLAPSQILKAYSLGDALAGRLMQNQAFFLAAGLTSVVHLLNPDVIVIGGGMIEAGGGLVEQVRKEFTCRSMRPMSDHVAIVPAQFGNRAGIIGAGLLSLKASDLRPYSHA